MRFSTFMEIRIDFALRSVVSYNTTVIDIYSPAEVEKAKNLSVYDSLDADVMQSYLEYSLASMIYYCMKVRTIIYAIWRKMVSLLKHSDFNRRLWLF